MIVWVLDGEVLLVLQLDSNVKKLAEEYDEYLVAKINVDEEPELAEQFSVFSIPTLVVIKNGEVVNTATGARPKEDILELLED